MIQKPYRVEIPTEQTTSLVFSCPHSGRDYNSEFLRKSLLSEQIMRSSEDAFVDLLFRDAPAFGAPLIVANTPRAFVDLNRNHDEFDPALIRGVPKRISNPRVTAGLGVIPRVVANGRVIQNGKLHKREADQRLCDHWHPYHKRLAELLDLTHQKFGQSILIDCHSMPHAATAGSFRNGKLQPDIVLGDRHGASADLGITDYIEDVFTGAGLRVARNNPFSGAFIVQNYGCPSRGKHAVQIEIDRSLYMNERTIVPNENFDELQGLISGVISKLVQFGAPQVHLVAE